MKYSWWKQFSRRFRLAPSVNTDAATYAKKKKIAEGERQEVEEGRGGRVEEGRGEWGLPAMARNETVIRRQKAVGGMEINEEGCSSGGSGREEREKEE